MKNLFLLAISLPLLFGGCGGEKKPVAETKPVEEAPLNPNLKYEIKDDTVTITGCDKKASGAVIIPATIEGKSVTSIGGEAFLGCKSLTGIIIPDGVTSIGDGAFSWCMSLTTIEVGEGNVNFTEVNGVLFNAEKTVLLTYPASKTGANYTIPDGVTSIGISAFTTCFSLTSITIPDGVTSIGAKAFQVCESLTSITIPDSVTRIGDDAFSDCNSLTAVTFLGDAPKVGENAFNNATPTIYRNPETKGWGDTFAGRPVKLISEKP